MQNGYALYDTEYFEWLVKMIGDRRYSDIISYERLLRYLHETHFRYSISRDENRACDGVDLRYRFLYVHDVPYSEMDKGFSEIPCSVLEMMVALSIACEEHIMDDPRVGDRTGQWFWGMIVNLGLGAMSDTRFDADYVYDVIERFLDREYEPDGKGGLFTIKDCKYDLRTVEIWYQLCWYLNGIV